MRSSTSVTTSSERLSARSREPPSPIRSAANRAPSWSTSTSTNFTRSNSRLLTSRTRSTCRTLFCRRERPSWRSTEYQVRVNSSPSILDELNNLPIRTINGTTVYVKDVAQVRDGFQPQQNIVRTNGVRGVLMTITRNGKASTLSIVNQVKAALPRILANVTPDSMSFRSPTSPSSCEPPSKASCVRLCSPPRSPDS